MAQTLAKMVNLEASYDPLLTPASDQEECGGPPCYSEPEPSQASGLRLSWPQEGNSKRARVGKLPSRGKYAQDARVHHSHIVQVSHRDIEMHYHLNNAGAPSARPFLEVPMPWNPTSLEVDHQDLLQYCQYLLLRYDRPPDQADTPQFGTPRPKHSPYSATMRRN